ncbi:hypothetical protein HELRODRAFT_126561, partial [Helobdella robusta]|uniref:CUB domain-containing protein n=1 Tax=Helobdella robusta TaxID=6412 RepID=T1EHA4_HELRO
FTYRSLDSRSGIFHSPNFPHPYPRNLTCHYKFIGRSNEHIVIVFRHVDVEGVMPNCSSDTKSDVIELSNYNYPLADSKHSPLCGLKKESSRNFEKKIYKYESDGNFFRVTFKANDAYEASGFEASYKFYLKDTSSYTNLKESNN